MKIELKKISFSEKLSQETNAYSAELYVDGKPIAICSNDGWGGPDMHSMHPKSDLRGKAFQDRLNDVNDYLKANNPAKVFGDITISYDLETFCGEAVERHAAEKWAKGQLSRNILIKQGDQIMTLRFRRGATKDQKITAAVKKYGESNVLNCMKKEEAIALLMVA